MLIVLGADWCAGCKGVKAKLTKLNLDYEYVKMPPGKEGWDLVEKMTGRRAVPAVFYKFNNLKEFNEALDSFDLEERELTEEELDELYD